MLSTGTAVRIFGEREVMAKLVAAEPRILAQNKLMVTGMLEQIQPIVVEATPLGPGHFGYHAKDRFTIKVEVKGTKTIGMLMGAIQAYWREFGTKGRHRKGSRLQQYARAVEFSGQGERAFMTAHKAAAGFKRLINFYYGGMVSWWRA